MMKEDPRSEYYGKTIIWWVLGIMGTSFALFALYIWHMGSTAFTG